MMSLKIGFEFEFAHDLVEEDKNHFYAEEYRTIKNALRKDVGLKFDSENNDRSYRNWTIYDDSVDVGGTEGCELVSPVMKYERGIAELRKVFEWMRETNALTDLSTGLHVNMSLSPARMKKLDPVKLVLLMDEIKWLDAFDRRNNEYCQPYHDYWEEMFSNNLYDYEEEEVKLPSGIWKFRDQVDEMISNYLDKYRSVNLEKLHYNTPWVEFRVMGGEDYHKKTDLVLEGIDHFAKSLKAACYVGKERATYRDKLIELRKIAEEVQ